LQPETPAEPPPVTWPQPLSPPQPLRAKAVTKKRAIIEASVRMVLYSKFLAEGVAATD
jgi:hypothetical protein